MLTYLDSFASPQPSGTRSSAFFRYSGGSLFRADPVGCSQQRIEQLLHRKGQQFASMEWVALSFVLCQRICDFCSADRLSGIHHNPGCLIAHGAEEPGLNENWLGPRDVKDLAIPGQLKTAGERQEVGGWAFVSLAGERTFQFGLISGSVKGESRM